MDKDTTPVVHLCTPDKIGAIDPSTGTCIKCGSKVTLVQYGVLNKQEQYR